MSISDLYKSSQANVVMAQANARQVGGASNVSPVETKKAEKSYDYADIKQQQKVASTQEKISSLGQLKSAISDTQSAAKEVQKLKANASSDEMAAAANTLANAYNTTLKVAKEGNASSGNNVDSVDSRRSGNSMRNGVTGGGLSTELQNAGFAVAEDGSVKIDQEKFKAAAANDPDGLRKALDKIGQKVEATSTKALDEKGELNASINKLKKNASAPTSSTTTSSESSNSSSAKKPDRSAETRRLEQEKFESDLKRKYQSYGQASSGQQFAVAA